jgi:glyoxylase-like metal-dependent hydrolase (beta-lactamase superfamily II)
VHENDEPLTRKPWQYAHERSRIPYLANPRAMPIVLALARNRAFFPPPVKEVRRYSEQAPPQVPGSMEVVFTPGHTLGHCALNFPYRDTVIAGDALVTLNPYTGETGPQIVAGAATADSSRNLESLDALAATGAGTVLTGHGDPFHGGVEAAVEAARRAGPS